MKCLLVGNYGAGNLGDEALREYFLSSFPSVQWIALSARPSRPNEVPRLPSGVRSLVSTPWWRTIRELRLADAVVFGGGSLFTDVESAAACLLWWWHGFVARRFRKPLILVFQGIGPFRTKIGRWCARNTVRHAKFVSVRDEESWRQAKRWNSCVVLSFDPVLNMVKPAARQTSNEVLAVIPRMNSGSALLKAVSDVSERNAPQTRILSLQPDCAAERRACEKIRAAIGPSASVHRVRSIAELAALLGGCGRVITERYHGAIAAIALGLPVEIIPQRDSDKLASLRTILRHPEAVETMRRRLLVGEKELQKIINMLK